MNKSFFFEDQVYDWGRFKKTGPHTHTKNTLKYPHTPPPPPAFFNSDGHYAKVQIRIVCAPKIVFISLPINKNMCFGAQKNRLNETVLLCTHNICYG